MSVAGVRRDPNPPYPASIHTVPYSTQLLCIYTIPFHTAYPAHYTPGSGPPVTNRTQQATNITIEDRWQGLRRKTHKIPHCSRGGERKRMSAQRRTCPPPLLPAPPPPTKCPQFFAHQSQYSAIVQCCRTMHRSQHFVRPLSRRRAAPAAT